MPLVRDFSPALHSVAPARHVDSHPDGTAAHAYVYRLSRKGLPPGAMGGEG